MELVQRYRLNLAYMLDAYDQQPGLRHRMVALWAKFVLFALTGLAFAHLATALHIGRTALVIVYSLICVGLFREAHQVNRQDYAVMQTFRQYCEQSKFLNRKSRRLG